MAGTYADKKHRKALAPEGKGSGDGSAPAAVSAPDTRDSVLYDVSDKIATITLNRPDSRNALGR